MESIILFSLSFVGLLAIVVLCRNPEPLFLDNHSIETGLDRTAVGAVPAAPEVPAAWRVPVGFIASTGSAAERRAMNLQIRDLEARIATSQIDLAELPSQIAVAEEHADAIPNHHRGWPLEIVLAFATISVLFEYVPAALSTQAFTTATSVLQLMLTVAFTTIGVALALELGELFRRTREPVRHVIGETVLFVWVALFVLAFLVMEYELRLAFIMNHPAATGLAAPIEAIALTVVAAIGIALIVVSSYFREGVAAFENRRLLRRLRRDLATKKTHLRTNNRDLWRTIGIPPNIGQQWVSATEPRSH